jgi:hypothetical protein
MFLFSHTEAHFLFSNPLPVKLRRVYHFVNYYTLWILNSLSSLPGFIIQKYPVSSLIQSIDSPDANPANR